MRLIPRQHVPGTSDPINPFRCCLHRTAFLESTKTNVSLPVSRNSATLVHGSWHLLITCSNHKDIQCTVYTCTTRTSGTWRLMNALLSACISFDPVISFFKEIEWTRAWATAPIALIETCNRRKCSVRRGYSCATHQSSESHFRLS